MSAAKVNPPKRKKTRRRRSASLTIPQRTAQRKADFLSGFLATSTIAGGCKAAGITRKTHYDWMGKTAEFEGCGDPKYVDAFREADEYVTDALEQEARRRAVDGVEEETGWYKGIAGGVKRRYSDVLLMFLLNARRPEKFRPAKDIHVSGANGGPIHHAHTLSIDVSKLSDDTLRLVRAELLESGEDDEVLEGEVAV